MCGVVPVLSQASGTSLASTRDRREDCAVGYGSSLNGVRLTTIRIKEVARAKKKEGKKKKKSDECVFETN